MTAGIYNIALEQGATYEQQIVWTGATGQPVNLTNYSAHMQVRASLESDDVLLELSSSGEDPHITLGGTAGTIVLSLPASVTGGIEWLNGVYDLELTSPSGFVTRLLQGSVTVSRQVTRD